MRSADLLVVTTHVLAAIVWLGGMMFFAIAAPLIRRIGDDTLRTSLFNALGRRFRVVGWICIAVLLATGVGQLNMRGWWGSIFWSAPDFWATALGAALWWASRSIDRFVVRGEIA